MLPRSLLQRTLRLAVACAPSRTLRTVVSRPRLAHPAHPIRAASHTSPDLARWMSTKSIADEKIDEITELYATAQDEFEIAMEETEKQTVYAEDDRKAAKEELDKVKKAYNDVVEGSDEKLADEVRRRIGQRIRELEIGVARLEEMAMEQD